MKKPTSTQLAKPRRLADTTLALVTGGLEATDDELLARQASHRTHRPING